MHPSFQYVNARYIIIGVYSNDYILLSLFFGQELRKKVSNLPDITVSYSFFLLPLQYSAKWTQLSL